MSQRRTISPRAIFLVWKDWLLEHKDIGEDDMPCCFACGQQVIGAKGGRANWKNTHLEKAHIVPLCSGGEDSKYNLHLLCSGCHKDSEFIETPQEYLVWAKSRSMLEGTLSCAFRAMANCGENIGGMVSHMWAAASADYEMCCCRKPWSPGMHGEDCSSFPSEEQIDGVRSESPHGVLK